MGQFEHAPTARHDPRHRVANLQRDEVEEEKEIEQIRSCILDLTIANVFECLTLTFSIGDSTMPAIIVLQRHSVENCPMNNEKMKKMASEMMDKLPALTKKHGIKMVGSWVIAPEHLNISVYEAPSLDAFSKFQREPAIMKWIAQHTTENKVAMTRKEAMKLPR